MSAASVSRALYTLALAIALPFALLRLLVRGVHNRGYWRHVPERFGFVTRASTPGATWVHAVSVGEVVAARPVVEALRGAGLQVFVSVGTPTGRARADALFASDPAITVAFVPYDLPPCIALTLARRRPARLVLMETELWPNLIAACARRGLPVILGNARLSARSARGYARFAALSSGMLGRLAAVGAQAEADAERLLALGAPRATTRVTGSTKFDVQPDATDIEVGRDVRARFAPGQPTLIAASTHPGEDDIVLDAFAAVRARVADARLILVPRHPERFALVAAMVSQRGLRVALRSAWPGGAERAEVLVGDTMGELVALYAAADVALVCGSLVPIGGHNPIEPAALGVPILVGPHVFNFAEISANLEAAGALQRVDAQTLTDTLMTLLTSKAARTRMGAAGRGVAARGRGATVALVALLEEASAAPVAA